MKSYGEHNIKEMDELIASSMHPDRPAKFPISMYYSEGAKYLRLRQYEKAVLNFNIALGKVQKEPSHVRILLERAKAYIGLQEYSKAREDAIEALSLWSEYSEAFDLKGRSEYLKGDYEEAFLTYFMGRQLKPVSERLRLGQQLCEKTIEDFMLAETKRRVDRHDIELLLKPNRRDTEVISGPCSTTATDGHFSADKKMFEELLSDDSLKSVHGVCQEGLEFIKNIQTFRAMQMPLHTKRKVPVQRRRVVKITSVIRHVMSVKRRCQYYLQKEMAHLCITESQKLLWEIETRLDLTSKQNVELKTDILHLLGLAYKREMKDSQSRDHFKRELEVAQTHDLLQIKIRALHHLGMYYRRKGKIRETCRCFLGIMDTLSSNLLQDYLEECYSEVKPDRSTVLNEIEAAEIWARNFKSKLKDFVQDSVIAPAKDLLLEIYGIYQVDMRTVTEKAMYRYSPDSVSDGTRSYFTDEEFSDSGTFDEINVS